MTVAVIKSFLAVSILALTPVHRWQAMRQPGDNFMTQRWFVMAGLVTIIVLSVLLIAVSIYRVLQKRGNSKRQFSEYSEKRGLSEREREILFCVASRADLKRRESIFTMSDAFDRGAAAIMTEQFVRHQSLAENRQFKRELSYLREKLGFKKVTSSSIGSASRRGKLNSRQIPAGKKVFMTRRKSHDSVKIEATVINNDDIELTVRMAKIVENTPGEVWRMHYHFGASVWEFDTSVTSCNGNVVTLNHNNNIRFINRRRFLRVPVKKPAFIALFPFSRAQSEDTAAGDKLFEVEQNMEDVCDCRWGLPEFVPAVVTELAGPGVRVTSGLETKVGDRVLVVFKLDNEKQHDSGLLRRGKKASAKIVEDIGEVKHIRAVRSGFSIAIELTGLRDSEVNELIRAANAASLAAEQKEQKNSESQQSHTDEATVLQGV